MASIAKNLLDCASVDNDLWRKEMRFFDSVFLRKIFFELLKIVEVAFVA